MRREPLGILRNILQCMVAAVMAAMMACVLESCKRWLHLVCDSRLHRRPPFERSSALPFADCASLTPDDTTMPVTPSLCQVLSDISAAAQFPMESALAIRLNDLLWDDERRSMDEMDGPL